MKAKSRDERDLELEPVTVHVRVIVDADGGFVSARTIRTENAEDRELEELFGE